MTQLDGSRRPAPAGWSPGVEWDGSAGTLVTKPAEQPGPDWRRHLADWGFDPDLYEVVEPVRVSTWEVASKGEDGQLSTKQLWAYKANIRERRSTRELAYDYDEIVRRIKQHAPAKQPPAAGQAASTFVVCPSDLQIGKGEGGGTVATTHRFLTGIDRAVRRLEELRRKRDIGPIELMLPGDAVEGCDGFYDEQRFTVDLNRRDQEKVARRLYGRAIEHFAKLTPALRVSAVPSNHGENRNGRGSVVTNYADNADLAIVETLGEIYAQNPAAYGHVSFVVPEDEVSVVLDVSGVKIGLSHGHHARSGSTNQAKLTSWWRGQSFAGRELAEARILITGHYHHFEAVVLSGRTWLQCPTLDGGSKYLTDANGEWSPPGLLTFVAGTGCGPLGWSDLEVLSVEP